MYKDFIEEITLFTKQSKKDSTVWLRLQTYGMTSVRPIKYKPEREDSFYNIRNYRQGEFKYGEKMPMMAIASSWYDERFNVTRFCGASVLSVDDTDTKELLDNSPNYYIISYIIR